MEQPINFKSFFPLLLSEVPEFEPAYRKHLAGDDDLIPYVLVGEFVYFVYDAQKKASSKSAEAKRWQNVLSRSLALMERAINSSDEQLETLIWLGFVENLTPDRPEDVNSYLAIKAQLGPKLHEVLITYFDPYHS